MQIQQIICTTEGAHFCDYPAECHRSLTPGLGHFIQPIARVPPVVVTRAT